LRPALLYIDDMGRISAHIRLTNLLDSTKSIEFDALVDAGSAYMVLPKAWQERLGELMSENRVVCGTTYFGRQSDDSINLLHLPIMWR
jgi:hypothetical protein